MTKGICLNDDENWRNTAPKCAENLRRKLQLFCITGSVALWSETKILNHNATVLQLGMWRIYSTPDPHGSPISRLLRHTRGCGGPILTRILTGSLSTVKRQWRIQLRDGTPHPRKFLNESFILFIHLFIVYFCFTISRVYFIYIA